MREVSMGCFDEVDEAGCASRGLVVGELSPLGITTPDGFTVTVDAYQEFIRSTSLRPFVAGSSGDTARARI